MTAKKMSGEEEVLETAKADIFPSNEKNLMTSDHCALIHLNEPCILENSRGRCVRVRVRARVRVRVKTSTSRASSRTAAAGVSASA